MANHDTYTSHPFDPVEHPSSSSTDRELSGAQYLMYIAIYIYWVQMVVLLLVVVVVVSTSGGLAVFIGVGLLSLLSC